MKIFSYIGILLILIFQSCEPKSKEGNHAVTEPEKDLPETIQNILNAHGGLKQWEIQHSMSYAIKKMEHDEVQRIDLKSRKEVINAINFSTGRDDIGVWLRADSTYKGNAIFYHNLMFYFIAMPFVLADDGILYSETQPLEFEGVSYPGVRIAYDEGVGFSPEDEYFLHYDPETFEMRWLGYTVTYFSKEKSKDVHWIRYNDWGKVDELLLPKSLDWYKYENGLPTEFRNKMKLDEMIISSKSFESSIFEKPQDAEYLE